ncbi:hypothetical protein L6259_00630 [Candidatus Parcubacteria bacterium]|nr:hypothetical protein [Patescibacteria group bacterium]MCG2693778.1 hypothetical protein [Candidatus Parcubacteria bacterium]
MSKKTTKQNETPNQNETNGLTYEEAIQKAVDALVAARYKLSREWREQEFSCTDPECKARQTGKPFRANASKRFLKYEKLVPALWLVVGKVPTQEGVSILCQRHSASWRSDMARKLVGDEAWKMADDATRKQNQRDAYERLGVVCLPLFTVFNAYELRLKVERDPMERLVQEILNQETTCAKTGVAMTYRKAFAVSDKAVIQLLQSEDEASRALAKGLASSIFGVSQETLEGYLNGDHKTQQQAWESLRQMKDRAPRDSHGYPLLVCRELADMINQIVGKLMVKRGRETVESDVTFRAVGVIRAIERGKETATQREETAKDVANQKELARHTGLVTLGEHFHELRDLLNR